jgi:hypothetical protein
MKRMHHLACGVLVAVAACKGTPSQLVAGIADTVVLHNVRPTRVPIQVLDADGHVLPDTGVRFEWMSGVPVPVSPRGSVTCTQAGDATLRASLGTLAKLFLVHCQPVHEVRGGGEFRLVVGDPPQDLLFDAVDMDGRPVRPLAARVSVSDTTVLTLERWRIRARAPGQAGVDIYIGDQWVHYFVQVYERARTLEGIRPGQHLAVRVRLAGGELHSWGLPPSPPNYFLTVLPEHDTQPTPRLAIERANCLRSAFPEGYSCFALEGAAVIVYHPRQADPAQLWSGALAIVRESCPRSERLRPTTGVCSS